jgi:branched-chain amino acid transport system substrate-binding protein
MLGVTLFGLVFTPIFYMVVRNLADRSSERFFKRTGRMPSMIHAGTYSATLSYRPGASGALRTRSASSYRL